MKKPIPFFVAGVLVMLFAIFVYAALSGKSKTDAPDVATVDSGEDLRAKDPSTGTDAAADPQKVAASSRGIASFYEVATNGTRTASGIPLEDSASTAAHRTLPFGTLVRVTNLSNGLSEIVEITDRGPFSKGRILDVSRNAATKLNMIKAGIVSVEIEVLP